MSVFNTPKEWADEMNRLFLNGFLNKDNYEVDVANAVVYVQESADKIDELEAEVEKVKSIAMQAVEMLDRESTPIWREGSPPWEDWHAKVVDMKQELNKED